MGSCAEKDRGGEWRERNGRRAWDGLTVGQDRVHRGEGIHDQGKSRPSEENDVGKQPDGAHPEGAVGNVVAAADEEADDGDGVRDVKEDDAGDNHARGGKRKVSTAVEKGKGD